MFDHDDRVGAFGGWGSGHDFDRFAGADLAVEGLAGTGFADDAEAAGNVGCAKGESVARGSVEWGIVAVGLGFGG